MKAFEANIFNVILRYYLIMAIVIASILSHNMVISILALPILITCLMGLKLWNGKKQTGQSKTLQSRESVDMTNEITHAA